MKKRVLFLCTHSSARSQMAEALLRHSAGDQFDVFSAGTEATRVQATRYRLAAPEHYSGMPISTRSGFTRANTASMAASLFRFRHFRHKRFAARQLEIENEDHETRRR